MKSTIQTVTTVLLLLLTSMIIISCASKAEELKGEQVNNDTGPLLPVDVLVLHGSAVIEQEVVVGNVKALKEVTITTEIPKRVSYVAFRDGSFVAKGQLLYKLDDSDIRAQVRQLHAELKLARLNEQRMSALLKTETIRQSEYDDVLMRLQSLEAQQDGLYVALSKTEIRAPFSGIIGITKVFAGAFVTPGTPMVDLQDQGSVRIEFSIPEKYVSVIKTGSIIEFTTEVTTDTLTASISATEPAVNTQDRSIIIHAIAGNDPHLLKPGTSAKVMFTTNENQNAIAVPTEALIASGSGYSVFLLKSGKAALTTVKISNRSETHATITSGLSQGDSLMVSNVLRASDGIAVQVVSSN